MKTIFDFFKHITGQIWIVDDCGYMVSSPSKLIRKYVDITLQMYSLLPA
jgi:hypothetical protein